MSEDFLTPEAPVPPSPSGYPQPPASQKPGQLTAIAVLTLVSGITNILAGLGWAAIVVISTLGIGLLCLPIFVLPIILGVFEIIYAAKLLGEPIRTNLNQVIPILEIVGVLTGNVISLVAGILALVFANDEAVKAYFAKYGPPTVQM